MTPRQDSYTHQGRRIGVSFHSTPQLYAAIFEDEYDGAPDSHCPMGFGRTEDQAVADLIEQDDSSDATPTPMKETP